MLTTPPPIDLSRATRLRTVDLRSDTQAVEWITRTLQTIKSQYLTEIAIFVPPFLTGPVQTVHREWEDLDHVLVQFLTSRSIRPVFKYKATPGSDGTGKRLRALLPELASRGVVDVAEIEGWYRYGDVDITAAVAEQQVNPYALRPIFFFISTPLSKNGSLVIESDYTKLPQMFR
jgi:hypothetical protein